MTVELRGERVILRPFRDDDREALIANEVLRPGVPGDEEIDVRLTRFIVTSGAWDEFGFLRFAIESDGRLVGDIQARRPPRAMPPGVCELGIGLFATADRGRGLGREAVRLFTEHLLAEGEMERVQLSTDVENHAMRRVAEALGFREEGIMRSFMPDDDGGRSDYVLYAVTRADHT